MFRDSFGKRRRVNNDDYKESLLEAASADVAGSETPNDDTVEGYHTAKFSGIPSAPDSASSSDRMVASTQSLEDLGVNHPANAAGSNADRQQHQQQQQQLQERYGHAYRSSAQTAQDKRSRLSNVINNLRKKVPDGASGNSDSSRKEEDDRNSVERNLETLEKYVMTVLNGVIKDNEEEDKNAEKTKELKRERKGADEEEEEEEEEEEDPTGTAVKSEPSSEGDIEAAVVPRLDDSLTVKNAEDVESSETKDCSNVKKMAEESLQDSEVRISQDSKQSSSRMEEECLDVEEKESSKDDRSVSRRNKKSRTLSTIIMDRLSEHQVEERANVDDGRGNRTRDEHAVSENTEIRTICDELLNDLLSNVYRTIDDHENQKTEDCEKSKKSDATESRVEETKDSSINIKELPVTGLHCSLPLDKVASVLQNCQMSESVTSRILFRIVFESSVGTEVETVILHHSTGQTLLSLLRQKVPVHVPAATTHGESASARRWQEIREESSKTFTELSILFREVCRHPGSAVSTHGR